jgi:hypothetical protein
MLCVPRLGGGGEEQVSAAILVKISYHSLSKKYLRKIASNIDMNIVHAYPIQNEEFLLRFSHLTNYLDRYVASKTTLY